MGCGSFTSESGAYAVRSQRRQRANSAALAPKAAGRSQMRSESPSPAGTDHVSVRQYTPEDQPFLARIASRMHPGQTASARDPAAVDRFFAELADSKFLT